jgi:hypothetical protein
MTRAMRKSWLPSNSGSEPGDILVKLKDIDPIHAITNNLALSKDDDFLEKKYSYNEEIGIVLYELRKNQEPLKEIQSQFKIK